MRFVYESTEAKTTTTTIQMPVRKILGILQINNSVRKRLLIEKGIPLVERLNISYTSIFGLRVRVLTVNVQQLKIFILQDSSVWNVGCVVSALIACWFLPNVHSILSVAIKLCA